MPKNKLKIIDTNELWTHMETFIKSSYATELENYIKESVDKHFGIDLVKSGSRTIINNSLYGELLLKIPRMKMIDNNSMVEKFSLSMSRMLRNTIIKMRLIGGISYQKISNARL